MALLDLPTISSVAGIIMTPTVAYLVARGRYKTDKQVADNKTALDDRTAFMSEIRDELKQVRADNRELYERIAELEKEVARLRLEVAQLLTDKTLLSIELERTKAENEDLKAQIAELEAQIAMKEAEIAELNKQRCAAAACPIRQPI